VSPIEATIFHDPATGCYGFRVRFLDRERPHFSMDTCLTLEAALDAIDPRRERVWDPPAAGDRNVLLVSRAYKEDSVMAHMETASLR